MQKRPVKVKVKSELIKKIQFFGPPTIAPGTGTLRVEYRDGTIFNYEYVSYYVYQQLLQAESPGKYWLKVRELYNWEQIR